MANLKEVRNRIQSVSSTQQITKAMKMVSAAKLRRSQDAITQLRPYSQKLSAIISNVSAEKDDSFENAFAQQREVKSVLIVVITSDRGLCGAFNSNVIKAANLLINDKYKGFAEQGKLKIVAIGKKGAEFFTKRNFDVNTTYQNLFHTLNFDSVRAAAEYAMNGFVEGEFDKIELIYNEFKNVATQIVRTEQFLPIKESAEVSASTTDVSYIYEPDKQYILGELIPKSLKIQFYKAVLESNASEHGARMSAMDKATDNAGELIKSLKLVYNRSRQAAITKEILEIVGGAEALNN